MGSFIMAVLDFVSKVILALFWAALLQHYTKHWLLKIREWRAHGK
jgi:hypothetical protein